MSTVIANMCGHLKLFEYVENDRPELAGAERTLDVVAWLPSDKGNRLIPITVCGVPLTAPGVHYALLNTEDKSYTTLDGQRFADFKSWRGSWAHTAAQANRTAEAVAPPLSSDPTRQPPKAWYAPQRVGR